jgi:glyoxylase-like metal-dependent hydrolase (beta-lactamase superfamily II)
MSEYPLHVEIEPHVHLIRGLNRARFPEANCILIDDEILTLVDAGANRNNIISTLKDLGHSLDDLQRIVLTHFHVDHKGLAAELQKESDCEVICHPEAERGVRSLEGLIDFYGIEGNKYFETWKYFLKLRLPHVFGDYKVDGHFDVNKPIDCGEFELIPIHSPGHTHDHTCFGLNGTDTIFLVDIDLTRFGPWYGNRVSDIELFSKSIRDIIELEPKMGISSHLVEPVSKNLVNRLEDYDNHFYAREKRVIGNLAAGFDTIEALAGVPTIYPRIPHDVYLIFEIFMLQKHLEVLERKDMVSIEDERVNLLRG